MLLLVLAAAAPAGPHKTKSKLFTVDCLDPSGGEIWAVYPASAGKFPLISYAHGLLGGNIDLAGYSALFHQIASYGFVVAAPSSCNVGCKQVPEASWTCAGIPSIMPGHKWNTYYVEHLRTIAWANQSSLPIDWSVGVGVAGHSMGGQATTSAAHKACTAKWGIKAAVLHHSAPCNSRAGNAGVNISIPLAAYTSSGDTCCEKSTKDIFAASPAQHKVYRDLEGSSHLEPVLWPPIENPHLAAFTAAWFKIYLEQDSGEFYDLIYGGGPDSLCRAQKVKECIAHPQELFQI